MMTNPDSFPCTISRSTRPCTVAKHGPVAMMAKFYVEDMHCNLAVHLQDPYLLGMEWHGQFFFDLVIPFALCYVRYIFNSMADMAEWIILNRYDVAHLVHYLEDFILADPPDSDQCATNLKISPLAWLSLSP